MRRAKSYPTLPEEEEIATCQPRPWIAGPVKEGKINLVEARSPIPWIGRGPGVGWRIWGPQEPGTTQLRRALAFQPKEGQVLRALLL